MLSCATGNWGRGFDPVHSSLAGETVTPEYDRAPERVLRRPLELRNVQWEGEVRCEAWTVPKPYRKGQCLRRWIAIDGRIYRVGDGLAIGSAPVIGRPKAEEGTQQWFDAHEERSGRAPVSLQDSRETGEQEEQCYQLSQRELHSLRMTRS